MLTAPQHSVVVALAFKIATSYGMGAARWFDAKVAAYEPDDEQLDASKGSGSNYFRQ